MATPVDRDWLNNPLLHGVPVVINPLGRWPQYFPPADCPLWLPSGVLYVRDEVQKAAVIRLVNEKGWTVEKFPPPPADPSYR